MGQSKEVAMKVGWAILICCIAILHLFDLSHAFHFPTDSNRHALRNYDGVERWRDWTSPTMLNLLFRATQKAQRLMAYKKKKNHVEIENRLLNQHQQAPLIYEQQVKKTQQQARPQRKTVPIFSQFSTLF